MTDTASTAASPSRGASVRNASSEQDVFDTFDDIDRTFERAMERPGFRAAYEDAQEKRRLLEMMVSCRKEQKLTQKEIAKRMGVGQSTVGGFETVEADPRLSTLQRYARALGGRLRLRVAMDAKADWLKGFASPYHPARVAGSPLHAQPATVNQSDNVLAWTGRSWAGAKSA